MSKPIILTQEEVTWIKKTTQQALRIISGSDMYDMLQNMHKKLKSDVKIDLFYAELRTVERMVKEMGAYYKQVEAEYKKRVKAGNEKSQRYLDRTQVKVKLLTTLEKKVRKCL